MPTENGFIGRLTSLAGVQGADGKGRVIDSVSVALTATVVLVLSSNPKRISALIQNIDDITSPGSSVFISLGNPGYAIDPGAYVSVLSPLGTLQIDKDFPWTGEVYACKFTNVVGSPTILVTEISIT